MSGLIKIDLEQLAAYVKGVLNDFSQVAGAFIYGSALDFCRPDSDLDLGLVLEPGIIPDSLEADRLEAEISCALTPVDGHPFDIVILNPREVIFTFRVI
jgi:predicted nucleotidyltransferase